jgi:uncharacterized heparinase superfamily protein
LNRVYARLSARQKAAAAFVSQPEPRTIGSFARGRQLMAGNYLFAGYLVEAAKVDIWDVSAPDTAFEEELQGFGWLDDLAAVGDSAARDKAKRWLYQWIDLYGEGTGPGWTPDLTGRRLVRWINHAIFLLRGQTDQNLTDAFYLALGQQTRFLSKRWHATPPGLPRFEALTGLIYAGLALEGMEPLAEPAIQAIAHECETQIDATGGLPTRNPEDLLDVFTLLTWASMACAEAGRGTPNRQIAALERIAPSLRTLRHSDGGLARFHGGGRGAEGWLDHALAASKTKTRSADGLSMGFARLSGGRSSVIIDASAPPLRAASFNGHASTLAFEMTSGRRPFIVNCGSGARFGADWRRAGRATASHSTLSIDGYSSSRFGRAKHDAAHEPLVEVPTYVPMEMDTVSDGLKFQGGHNGYVPTHGLTHARTLELTFDGRGMVGEDMLLVIEDADQPAFDRAFEATKLNGIAYTIRFHLHPEVDATIDLGGKAVSMALKSGEIWVFRHDETLNMALEPSVYLEKGRLKPRAAKQIVLSGKAMGYATRIRWSLSKAQDTAVGLRDLETEDLDLSDLT